MTDSIQGYVNSALDASYNKAAGQVLNQVAAMSNAPNSAMQKSLSDLDKEAAEKTDAEERITPDNPQLEKTVAVYGGLLLAAQSLILANGASIQEAGAAVAIPAVTAKVFLSIASQIATGGKNPITTPIGVYVEIIASQGINWTIPGGAEIAADYVTSEAWISKMERWGAGYANLTEETIINGIRNGWGPKKVAAEMRSHAQNIPVSAAENLTRTLQLTSYRDAEVAMERLNGRYITRKIRIAKLDDKTCLTCIALHGTELAPGERVNDHYRGRCSCLYQTPGGPEYPEVMQADSVPGKRNFVTWQSGEDWFASLPPERQARQNSFLRVPAKKRAYDGGVPLSDFVGDHEDSVFGAQVVEKSLVNTVSDPEQYYVSRKAEE